MLPPMSLSEKNQMSSDETFREEFRTVAPDDIYDNMSEMSEENDRIGTRVYEPDGDYDDADEF